ncbi:MAG: metallophosphoesterase family protein [Chloroflexota bacterium]
MRIGVISDTHAKTFEELPSPMLAALAGVDLIVHAGDITAKAVLDGLKTLGKVKAVHGNMDSSEVKAMLPSRGLFTVSGKRVGLVHGSGAPWGIAKRVRTLFGDNVDIIIFGHSHEPHNEYARGTLLFNPGRGRDSFGILTIGQEIEAEITNI